MPIYEFQRSDGKRIEKIFGMKDEKPESIEFEGFVYNRVFSIPNINIDGKIAKTIGSLAEKNTREMEKRGTLPKKKKKENPWWRPNGGKPNTKLSKLSKKQQDKYIQTGTI